MQQTGKDVRFGRQAQCERKGMGLAPMSTKEARKWAVLLRVCVP